MELLAPAGNMDKLKMALLYGADAVYLGGKSFGLRAFSDNFSLEEMEEAVRYAHELGKKVHVTVNIFPHNADLNGLPEYLTSLRDIHVDAVLIADPGIFSLARQIVPDLPVHISTQANVTNWASAKFWHDAGAKRVVMAREVSLKDVKAIHDKVPVELEGFVHGAMCISYSGRCLLSNYFTENRDSNRGQCVQCCRFKYNVVEEKRPGQYFPVMEDERGTYIFNSKDLCLLPYLPDLYDAGLCSLKIEGRMKSVHYVATVVKVYRQAIDAYERDPEHFRVLPEWIEELEKISHRPYTRGFSVSRPTEADQVYSHSSNTQTHEFIGLVRSYDAERKLAWIEQRNHFKVGQTVEFLQPKGKLIRCTISRILDEDGQDLDAARHAQQVVAVPVDEPLEAYSMMRREMKRHA
ncbi:peptidase U32 family protein [Megasphaera stantonii]|uniref:peptidase U32 family protein n=1 Tax=Megasphaera stantonii TaxID=2144175 RepID=UPI001DD3D76F|nr:U32 family peptidase [Megasphaera stantonii]HJE82965.1 U32 family peptidase [Megasphaera stantonii]